MPTLTTMPTRADAPKRRKRRSKPTQTVGESWNNSFFGKKNWDKGEKLFCFVFEKLTLRLKFFSIETKWI